MLIPRPFAALLCALIIALSGMSVLAIVTAHRADQTARMIARNAERIGALEQADSAILKDGARAHYRLCLRIDDNRAAINDLPGHGPQLSLYDCAPNLLNLPPTLLDAKRARAFQTGARTRNYLP